MRLRRRNFLHGALGVLAGALGAAVPGQVHAQHAGHHPPAGTPAAATMPGGGPGAPVAVEVPDVPRLPYAVESGVKVFRLTAEPVKTEFLPGKVVDVWGYNGHNPGPTIEVNEGDRVRILFENRLPEPTTVHWHGIELPIEMDGVPAISQPLVRPGGRFTYEFTLRQNGTFFYHTHMAMQEMLGLLGLFIIHPREPYAPAVHRDFGIILQEWAVLPNNTVPNTLSMEFNWLTFNGKAGPAITPMLVKLGERVRIRLVNIGMDHHPIHLHGMQFEMTGTEGGRVPEPARYPQNTIVVGVGQARDIEFEAKYPGDWMLHCHLPHHMMNQMVSMVGPMAHWGHALETGKGMEEGMGVMKGHALSGENAPGFGRGMGMVSAERPATPLVGPVGAEGRGGHGPHAAPAAATAGRRARVPGYPQDMWMPMDDRVVKPQAHGLPRDWSAALGGMMTLVRVLPPDKYDQIAALVREQAGAPLKSPATFPGGQAPAGGGHHH